MATGIIKGGVLPIKMGGTEATTARTARENLGIQLPISCAHIKSGDVATLDFNQTSINGCVLFLFRASSNAIYATCFLEYWTSSINILGNIPNVTISKNPNSKVATITNSSSGMVVAIAVGGVISAPE